MNDDNQKLLYSAIESDNGEEASLLLEKGALVGNNFYSFLSKAIEKNNHVILKMLIDHGMQDNQSMNLKQLLNAAILQGNPLMIEAILPHCGFSKPSDLYIPRELVIKTDPQYKDCVELLLKWNFTINPASYNDEEFIFTAVENGHLPIVVDLLNFGIDVNMVNSNTGVNLLTTACLNKHHQVVKKLLEHNADLDVKISSTNKELNNYEGFNHAIRVFKSLFPSKHNVEDPIDLTCLHIAVLNFDWSTADILFKYGARIQVIVELFYLICYTVRYNYEEVAGVCLDHGVKVTDINLSGKPLLYFCVCWVDYENDYGYNVAKLLLEKGADIHLKIPNNKLLFNAINNRHCKTAQLFLDWNADIQYISPDGDTSLHKAVEKDFDVEFIKTLLKLNSPVDIKNAHGFTPLHIACKTKSESRLDIIEVLLNNDADVNCTDNDLRTPLHLACDDPDLELVTLLLKNGANSHMTNGNGETPLHSVCRHGGDITLSVIELLLKHGADIEAGDNKGWTPLFTACSRGNYTAVKCLLHNHANFYAINHEKEQLLHVTCHVRSDTTVPVIKLLLGCGLNIEAVDDRGWTPLFRACMDHDDDAVKCLLENNANPNAVDSQNQTPLHYVCKYRGNKALEMINLLLKYGADIDAVDKKGWTPLFVACEANHDVTVQYLLSQGANLHHTDLEHSTPLHVAIKNCKSNHKVVDVLLNYNVNVHSIDIHGKSVIHYLYRKHNKRFIKRLAAMGVNFNSVDEEGNTPLHIAVKKSSDEIVKSLIKCGADINILNRNNNTPLQEVTKIDYPVDDSDRSLRLIFSMQYKILILMRQVVKLKVAGLRVHHHNLNIIYDSVDGKLTPRMNPDDEDSIFDPQKLEMECEREIEMMKKRKIGFGNFTFYDLLTKHIRLLNGYVEKQNIQPTLDSDIFKNKFSLYSNIIKSRVREASIRCKREKLMDSARNYFRLNISRRLPDECIDMVLDYLNMGEVEIFVEAMKFF